MVEVKVYHIILLAIAIACVYKIYKILNPSDATRKELTKPVNTPTRKGLDIKREDIYPIKNMSINQVHITKPSTKLSSITLGNIPKEIYNITEGDELDKILSLVETIHKTTNSTSVVVRVSEFKSIRKDMINIITHHGYSVHQFSTDTILVRWKSNTHG